MSLFKKKKAEEPMDLDSVMKKYDRESNVRIWEGKPRIAVNLILATFSVFCLCVTLFASWLEELRLTTFVAWIVLLGYLVFPAKKGRQRVNYIPWYDLVLMTLGTAAFCTMPLTPSPLSSRAVFLQIIRSSSASWAFWPWRRFAAEAWACPFWWWPGASWSMP